MKQPHIDAKATCLGALMLGEASGYEIRKRFESTFSHMLDIGFGSIYPALAELERLGMVDAVEVRQTGRPDKKVYSITEAGRASFIETLLTCPARHKVRSEFGMVLFFADMLPRERIDAVLDQRLVELDDLAGITETWLASDEGKNAPAGIRFAAEYGLEIMNANRRFIRTKRDELTARLPAKSGPANVPDIPRKQSPQKQSIA